MADGAAGRIETIFCDVGGVCLTNGWGAEARAAAARHFDLDAVEFGTRHAGVVESFERGHLSLAEYLDQVVFDRPRPFGREAFIAFMRAQSRPYASVLSLLRTLAAADTYRLATISNESRELNRYRIDTFGLAAIFQAFFTSCYLGVAKPDARIYAIALDVMQAEPAATLFVDDRAENAAAARAAGMRAIHLIDPESLPLELRKAGIDVPSAG